MSDSLRPHGPQHARLPCPSLSPGVCSESCLLSQWCHPTISSSVVPFFSCPQSLPASAYPCFTPSFFQFSGWPWKFYVLPKSLIFLLKCKANNPLPASWNGGYQFSSANIHEPYLCAMLDWKREGSCFLKHRMQEDTSFEHPLKVRRRKGEEGGDVYILMADSLSCTTETNTAL